MNVLFDAAWLAGYKTGSYMHGGLRVTYELAKRLLAFDEVKVKLTVPDLNKHSYYNLQRFVSSELNVDLNLAITNDSFPLQAYYLVSDLFHTDRGMAFMRRKYDFLNKSQLNKFDVYHSPVDAIPSVVKEVKKIKPFLTALDLIALVRPDLAYQGFNDQLFNIYKSIDENTTVLAISQSTKNDLLNYRKDIKEENVIVTYIAADKQVFYPNHNATNTDAVLKNYNLVKNNYFFTLSAHAKFKNTKHTVDCFLKYAIETRNDDLKLLVVGRNRGNDYGSELYATYGKHPQIVFLEFLPEDQLSILYSNAIAFLYMSLYEGFGLPILEAMQCSTPVICSNTSSMPEVIGDAGICIDPTDSDTLCEAIGVMFSNSEERKKFSQLGMERANFFSWDNYTNSVISAYRRVL